MNLVAPTVATVVGSGAAAGDVLRVTPGLWVGRGDVAAPLVERIWLRNDLPIPGETGPELTLSAQDIMAGLAVRETALNSDGARTVTAVFRAQPFPLKIAFDGVSNRILTEQVLTAAPGEPAPENLTIVLRIDRTTDDFANDLHLFGRTGWGLRMGRTNGWLSLRAHAADGSPMADASIMRDFRTGPFCVIASIRRAGFDGGQTIRIWTGVGGAAHQAGAVLNLGAELPAVAGPVLMGGAFSPFVPYGGHVTQWIWGTTQTALDPFDPAVQAAFFTPEQQVRPLPADGTVLGVRPQLFLNGSVSFATGVNYGSGGPVTIVGSALGVSA